MTNEMEEERRKKAEATEAAVKANLKKATYIAIAIAVVGLIFISIAIPMIGPVRIWLIWIFLVVAYFGFSWRWWDPVNADEKAARLFFGRNAGDVDSGVPYAPLGLVQVKPLTVKVQQREFPGNPNEVYKGDLSLNPTVDLRGKVLPIRIPFSSKITEEEAKELFGDPGYTITNPRSSTSITFNHEVPDDGLASRITADLYMIVRFTPRNIYLFMRNIGDIDAAIKQIEDEMVSTATQFLGRMSYSQAIANMRWLDMILYQAVARRTGANDDDISQESHSWGIELHDVRIKSIELDHTTNKSIRDAAAARFKASATITDAEADKKAFTLRGHGEAQAARQLEQQTLIGRAAGQKKLAEDLGVTGAEVQAAEVAREIAKGGNAIIFGADGLAQAASVVSAMVKGKNPPNPPA